jgi:hypothetical protein
VKKRDFRKRREKVKNQKCDWDCVDREKKLVNNLRKE